MSVVANVAINVDSRGAVSQLKSVENSANATNTAVKGLLATVSKIFIALEAIQAARFVFVKTAELESQTRSLEVLTGSTEKAKKIISELQELGAATPFTSAELIESAKRLQAFGIEGNKVVETTRRLADVSGATGAELQGLVTAYGQVQAKGKLQGEELLQFQERGVALQQQLQKMYGLSGEEFSKALSKGRIGAEAVEVAIVKLTNAGGKYANGAIAQSNTLSGKFSTLIDNVEMIAKKIGTILSPAIKNIIDSAIGTIENVSISINVLADLIKKIPQPISNTTAQIIKAVAAMVLLQKSIQALITLRLGFIAVMTSMAATTTAIGTAATGSASATALYINNTKALQAAAASATPVLIGLRAALANLAKIGLITIGVSLVISGIEELIKAQKELNRLRGINTPATFAGSASEESKKTARETISAIKKERETNKLVQAASSISGPGNFLINMREKILAEREKNALAILALPTRPKNIPQSEQVDTPGLRPDGKTKRELKDLIGTDQGKDRAGVLISKLEYEIEKKRLAAIQVNNKELAKQLANQKQLIRPTEEIKALQESIAYVTQNRNKYLAQGYSQEKINSAIAVYKEQIQIRENELRLKALGFEQESTEAKQQSLETGGKLIEQLQREKDAFKASSGIQEEILQINNKHLDNQQAIDDLLDERQKKQLNLLNDQIKAQSIEKVTKELRESALGSIEQENALLEARLAGKEKEYLLEKQIKDLVKAGGGVVTTEAATQLVNKNQQLKQQTENDLFKYIEQLKTELANVDARIVSISQTVQTELSSAMSTAVAGVIQGTTTVQQAFSQLFANIGQSFIQMATQMITKALMLRALNIFMPATGAFGGGGLPGFGGGLDLGGGAMALSNPRMFSFAAGGIPPVGRPSLVGEQGPELFVPRTAGTIIPNHKIGGDNINVVVNVDAKGTNIQGNDQLGNQLGRVVSAAVKQELIQQRRPGGLLS